jgi:hypothetical protein
MSANDFDDVGPTEGSDGHRAVWFAVDRPVQGGTVFTHDEGCDDRLVDHGF